jgi:hypothetical protein
MRKFPMPAPDPPIMRNFLGSSMLVVGAPGVS